MTQTTKTPGPRRMAREATTELNAALIAALAPPSAAKPQTKASLVGRLLSQTGGASLPELCEATGWLPHTCRAFLTGLRKRGIEVERASREDGATVYRITSTKAAA